MDLVRLVDKGVINALKENINGASIDVRLDSDFLVELEPIGNEPTFVDLETKQSMRTVALNVKSDYILHPGQFVLARTMETFNLPNDIAAEFKLKSSIARSGLNHLLAGFADPGWNNSRLTLELKNSCQYHSLVLKPGKKIGQMLFYRVNSVPHENSYTVQGRYNNTLKTTASLGV
jgi:dCTP deaminase